MSVNDLIVRACGLALRDNRQFHRSFDGEHMVYHGARRRRHRGGARRRADRARRPRRWSRRRCARWRSRPASWPSGRGPGTLKQPEIEGATFTVSNLGMFGVTQFGAIINPPEPGILAVGATVERAVPRDGEVTAAADHERHAVGRPPGGVGRRRGALPAVAAALPRGAAAARGRLTGHAARVLGPQSGRRPSGAAARGDPLPFGDGSRGHHGDHVRDASRPRCRSPRPRAT